MRWIIFLPIFMFMVTGLVAYPFTFNPQDRKPLTAGIASATLAFNLWGLLGTWYFTAHSTNFGLSLILAIALGFVMVNDMLKTLRYVNKVYPRLSPTKFMIYNLAFLAGWTALFIQST